EIGNADRADFHLDVSAKARGALDRLEARARDAGDDALGIDQKREDARGRCMHRDGLLDLHARHVCLLALSASSASGVSTSTRTASSSLGTSRTRSECRSRIERAPTSPESALTSGKWRAAKRTG